MLDYRVKMVNTNSWGIWLRRTHVSLRLRFDMTILCFVSW